MDHLLSLCYGRWVHMLSLDVAIRSYWMPRLQSACVILHLYAPTLTLLVPKATVRHIKVWLTILPILQLFQTKILIVTFCVLISYISYGWVTPFNEHHLAFLALSSSFSSLDEVLKFMSAFDIIGVFLWPSHPTWLLWSTRWQVVNMIGVAQ